MRRLLVGLFLAASVACAPATNAEGQGIRPALFVARDADSTMYLFGTVHVRRRGDEWGGAHVRAALAEAEDVWTEILINPEADARTRELVAELGSAPPGRPLSSWLTEDENVRLAALAQRLGVPMSMLEPMQPWIAALTLSVIPLMQAGYDPQAGVDRAIDAEADTQGKRMRALETIEEQMGFLAGLSPELQRQMLLDAITDAGEGAAQLDVMSAAWERGDIATLQRVVIDDTRAEYPELYDVVFVQRNAAWIDTLMRELEGEGVDFVAVGAGHLLGEHGLIAMLRARGVSVERVE